MKRMMVLIPMVLLSTLFLRAQNSLNFDGVDDNITIPNGGALNNLQTGTIEMWVKWIGNNQDEGYYNHYGAVMGRQSNGNYNNQLISLDGADPDNAKITWAPYNYGSISLTSASSPGSNTWVHLAITYESGSHKMYINGVEEVSSGTIGAIEDDASVLLSIGAWLGDGDSYSNTEIDEVRIWGDIRTEQEINDNMNIELVGDESDLLAYYNFNQGVAGEDNSGVNTLIDLTSNYDGTLNYFALTGSTSNWVEGMGLATSNPTIKGDHDLTVHPNPVEELLYVSGFTGQKAFTIYDLSGKSIMSGLISNSEGIDVNDLTEGTYFLRLEDCSPMKFIKQ